MHVNFDPNSIDWSNYFNTKVRQAGAGKNSGSGPFFVGMPYQRGAGVGSFFRRIIRFLLPLMGEAGREIGREGISTGVRVLGDLAEGKPLRNSVVNGASEGLKNMVRRANPNEGLVNLIDQAANKLQKGGGIRGGYRTRPRHKRNVSRAVSKRGRRSVRLDALGFY